MRLTMVAMALLVTAVMLPEAGVNRHIVGGLAGWRTNVNYRKWACGKKFYNGDWLCTVLFSFTNSYIVSTLRLHHAICILYNID